MAAHARAWRNGWRPRRPAWFATLIGRVTANYHGVFKHFPGNSQAEGGWDWNYQSGQKSWSWLARLLPYLEQNNLYVAANIDQNTFVQSQVYLADGLPVFWCPSDTSSSMSPDTNCANLEGQPIATSNYKGVTGSCWAYGTYVNQAGSLPVSTV